MFRRPSSKTAAPELAINSQASRSQATNSAPTYDAVPYPKKSHPGAHIRRAETLATLFDLKPTPITGCRVLELGCAAGWNLVPQAFEFTDSQFIGVDASATQIAAGRELVESLSLTNIELRQADLRQIDESWGKFDYILCHGVYSWVPPEVQHEIMRISKENLAPDGVAHISYNVLPGWHFRGIVRDMMLYHTAQFDDPEEKLSQARAVLDFMAENCLQDTPYSNMLSRELELAREAEDGYLFHDHLETENNPIYFHEFCRRADKQGLQYLADICFADMLPQHLPEAARKTLANAPLIKQEQYMDFLRNNTFRQSLLCHASLPINRALSPAVLDRFHLSFNYHQKPESATFVLDDDSNGRVEIRGRSIETDSPAGKVALATLIDAWPRAITLEQLQRQTERKLVELGLISQAESEQLPGALAHCMMQALANGMLEIFAHPPAFADSNVDHPMVSRLVREQAKLSPNVTTPHHRNVQLDEGSRLLIQQLDGRQSRQEIAETLSADAEFQEALPATARTKSKPLFPAGVIGNMTTTTEIALPVAQLDRAIDSLAKSGLLVTE